MEGTVRVEVTRTPNVVPATEGTNYTSASEQAGASLSLADP